MSEFQQQTSKTFKTIIVGRTNAGKSTLLLKYIDDEYRPQKATIGMDYKFKNITYKGKKFVLELWDSAGQERFRTIVYNYFNRSKAACVVFDITSEESLNDAKMWLQQLVLHCGDQIPKILLGNKCDIYNPQKLEQQIQKYKPKIDKLKQEYHCEFFPVSAYDGTNVEKSFNYLIKEIYEKNNLDKKSETKEETKDLKFKLKSQIILPKDKKIKKPCC